MLKVYNIMETLAIIPRPHYLDKILPFVNKGMIKVLTGQRRVGKSYILNSVESEIRKMDSDANFVRINLEDFAYSHITTAEALNSEITSKLSSAGRNYIFVDEIQEVEGFERVIRSLNLNPLNDIYVTGSNSAMLSSEIASRLAGRSVEIRVHPLSYTEFLVFHSLDDSDSSLDMYLRFGGMPYLRNLTSQAYWNEYLTGITDALVYRDIVERHSLRNTDFLSRLMMFLADNIGQLVTAKRIADYLKSQRVGGTVSTVQSYVEYICQAYLINRSRRWNIEGKKFFEIGEKYYFEDLGIRNSIIGYRPNDISGILENAVYNQLAFKGYKVMTGIKSQTREIDFVAEKNGEITYIQVALNIDNHDTAERELGNLASIPDNYEKMLITLRDSAPNTQNGIKMISLREFLKS